MPFINRTRRVGLDKAVRKSFYSHFSSKNYYDFELNEIDSSLEAVEKLYAEPWRSISPQELGRFFNADFIVFGEVLDYKKIYLGVYSQISLTVKVDMIETREGMLAWAQTLVKRSHQGDVPMNPFAALSASVRSGLHLQEENVEVLTDKLCREIVENIPDQPPPAKATAFWADVQMASFSDPARASRVEQEFAGKGFRARTEQVRLKDNVWHRVLLGPYINTEAEKLKKTLADDPRFAPILIHHSNMVAGND